MSGAIPLFDAQAALGFVIAQTAIIEPGVYKTVYPSVQYRGLIPVDTSGSEFATSVTYFSSDQYGKAGWINGNASDIPKAGTTRAQHQTGVHTAGIGYGFGWEEVGRAQMLGIPLQADDAAAARQASEEMVDRVALLGDTEKGFTGLFNAAGVTPIAAPTGDWVSATQDQIVADMNQSLLNVFNGTNTASIADRLLLPCLAGGIVGLYARVAKQALEYAESMRGANLSERALAEAAAEATSAYNSRVAVMARVGSEQERMVAKARAIQEAEARTANETRQAAAAVEAKTINLQQLLGQIDPTIGALNRLAAIEDRLERAHKAGLVNSAVFEQYQAKIDAMRASVLNATNAQNGMGMSARQLQSNLRMVPMQVTDITTSLLSGQPAWMVAIQQGGQLKDAFGGIGPAARAVGSYVLGLVNPLTVAAAALGALVIAAKQSEDQLFEFHKAQILSGQMAAVGSAGFVELASSIDKLTGVTHGGAVAALTETAKAGRYAGEQFELVAAVAARMEASAGRSLAATVGAFEAISKDPVEGLLKLNEAERFLTAAQLQRITVLRDEGRSQEAANEAIQIYASHLDDVANRTEAAMPAMSKGWRDIKDDIGGAWGALGNFTSAVVDLAGEWGVLSRLPRLTDFLGLGLAGGTVVKAMGLPSLTEALNGAAVAMRGIPPLPTPIDERQVLDPQTARDLAAVAQERRTSEQAAAEAINAQVAGLDRATAKEAARLKIIAQYNRLADSDARHFDGSMQRLIEQSNGRIDKQFNSSEKGPLSQGEKEAQTLARAFESLNGQLAQQIALYGEKSRLSQVSYQIEHGNLRGLNSDLAESLRAQAAQLDAQDRQKAALQDILKVQSDLNHVDGRGLELARERLRVLNEAKGEGVVSDDNYNATLAKILSAGGDAPKSRGADALYGGASGELQKIDQQQEVLQAWYLERVHMLDTLRLAESSINAEYDAQALAAYAEYSAAMSDIDAARKSVMLTAAEQGFGAVAEIMRSSLGEQSNIYRAAFAVSKTFSLAKAALAAKDAVSSALSSGLPFPANLAAMAAASAAVADLVGEVSAIGMAHDGIHSVPREGTWLLEKGERVLTAGTAAKMDATLDRIAAGGGGAGASGGQSTFAPQIFISGDPDARTMAALRSILAENNAASEARVVRRVAGELYSGNGAVSKGLRAGNNVSRQVR